MNKLGILLFSVLTGCNFKPNCKLIFRNTSNAYCSDGKFKNDKEESLFSFFEINGKKNLKETGFYLDGFRNDNWSYNFNNEIKTIKWAHFEDKQLQYETNVFSKIDSVIHGDFFSILKLKSEVGNLKLTISINSPLKDSSPDINYRRVTETDLKKVNRDIIFIDTKEISDEKHSLHSHFIIVWNNVTKKKEYIKDAYCSLDKNTFVGISVHYDTENDLYASILFDAVITNFYTKNLRLFNPFKRD